MSMASAAQLTGLSPREAVIDALSRCLLGIDGNNRELFESACVKDETMTFSGAGFSVDGWTAISAFFDRLFSLVTTHISSNHRVELKDGGNTATMTAHAISYHNRPDDAFKPEDTSYTAGALYTIELIKDSSDSLWKIKKWDLKALWTTGDIAVVHP